MTVFIPGKLRNPLNGSWGGWRKHARLAKDWRERTASHVWVGLKMRCPQADYFLAPKRVTFTAHVGRRWDDDNLPAAIKPIRDALQGLVIESDGDEKHEFLYRQLVNRKERGVQITIEPR